MSLLHEIISRVKGFLLLLLLRIYCKYDEVVRVITLRRLNTGALLPGYSGMALISA